MKSFAREAGAGERRLDHFARSLRFALTQKDFLRADGLPSGELVLLLSEVDGARRRVVVRWEGGSVVVTHETAGHSLPQAVIECLLSDWMDYVHTGQVTDIDRFDLFGRLDVFETFLRVYRLQRAPMSIRCQNMLSKRRSGDFAAPAR